jgi:hypothetical protein
LVVVFKPCNVPWSISATSSGLTLLHAETSVAPECSVVFGAGRLTEDDRTDMRRVEITFSAAWYARAAPHSDNADLEEIGYSVEGQDGGPDARAGWLAWSAARWRTDGFCTFSGFYVTDASDWLTSAKRWCSSTTRHYVLWGRDGHVEVLAERYAWREWLWTEGERDHVPATRAVSAQGEGS